MSSSQSNEKQESQILAESPCPQNLCCLSYNCNGFTIRTNHFRAERTKSSARTAEQITSAGDDPDVARIIPPSCYVAAL
jgi:hypothetical protein